MLNNDLLCDLVFLPDPMSVTMTLRTGQSQAALDKEKPPEILSPDLDDIEQIDKDSRDLFKEVLTVNTLSKQVKFTLFCCGL